MVQEEFFLFFQVEPKNVDEVCKHHHLIQAMKKETRLDIKE